MTSDPPAKFFVNSGLVANPGDMYNLLRPLLKPDRHLSLHAGRARLISHGTGWVERIVVDRPSISTFFTPLSICVNVDSFEHLEFETRPDQLLVYTLVQGDERVVVEYAAVNGRAEAEQPEQQVFTFSTTEYVQMELGALGGFGGLGDLAGRCRRWLSSSGIARGSGSG